MPVKNTTRRGASVQWLCLANKSCLGIIRPVAYRVFFSSYTFMQAGFE